MHDSSALVQDPLSACARSLCSSTSLSSVLHLLTSAGRSSPSRSEARTDEMYMRAAVQATGRWHYRSMARRPIASSICRSHGTAPSRCRTPRRRNLGHGTPAHGRTMTCALGVYPHASSRHVTRRRHPPAPYFKDVLVSVPRSAPAHQRPVPTDNTRVWPTGRLPARLCAFR